MTREQRAEALRLAIHLEGIFVSEEISAVMARQIAALLRSLAAQQAPAEPGAYREGAPLSAAILERENWLAVADQRLYGIGFTVNGWHVPAPLVAVFGAVAQPALPPAPQAREPLTYADRRSLSCIARWVNDHGLSDAEVRSIVKAHPMIERALSDAMTGITADRGIKEPSHE